MSVVVVGLEHNKAPLDLLERVSVGELDLAKVLGTLRDRGNFEESVLLSTCLRTEVYAVVDRFHDAVTEVQELLADKAGLSPSGASRTTARSVSTTTWPPTSSRWPRDWSRPCWARARSWARSGGPGSGPRRSRWPGPSCPTCSATPCRPASGCARRRPSPGAPRRSPTPRVELAESRRPGGLAGARVVVVGAGDDGPGPGGRAGRAGRGPPAGRGGGGQPHRRPGPGAGGRPAGPRHRAAVAFDRPGRGPGPRPTWCSRPSRPTRPIIDGDQLEGPAGRTRPLLVVDLGRAPQRRPGTPWVVPGSPCFDMDDLRSSVAQAMDERRWPRSTRPGPSWPTRSPGTGRPAGPGGPRRWWPPCAAGWRSPRTAELDRHRGQLAELPPEQWAQVDAVTRAVLAKLLHEPTVLLKETAGTPRGERLVEALRILFDL